MPDFTWEAGSTATPTDGPGAPQGNQAGPSPEPLMLDQRHSAALDAQPALSAAPGAPAAGAPTGSPAGRHTGPGRPRAQAGSRPALRLVAVGLAGALVLAAGVTGAALGLRAPEGRILTGISVAGLPLGDRTPEEAEAYLSERLEPTLQRSVAMVDGRRSWQVTPAELGCSFDAKATVAVAMRPGHEGSLLQQARDGWEARRHGISLKARWHWDRKALSRRMRKLAAAASIPARPARIRFDGRKFLITPEEIGRAVDRETTEKNLVRYFDPAAPHAVTLVAHDDVPAVKAEDLRKVDARLVSFHTDFNPGDVNRTQNLTLAAHYLNGTVVPAHAVFSFNDSVGPRLVERGYKVAKIFLRGKILDGVGGGTCQVATTAYNAALEAHMPILERARHSRPVTYAPPGRDATVSYGGVDLKFRNRTDAPILIQTRVSGGRLTVSFYGSRRFCREPARAASAAPARHSG